MSIICQHCESKCVLISVTSTISAVALLSSNTEIKYIKLIEPNNLGSDV